MKLLSLMIICIVLLPFVGVILSITAPMSIFSETPHSQKDMPALQACEFLSVQVLNLLLNQLQKGMLQCDESGSTEGFLLDLQISELLDFKLDTKLDTKEDTTIDDVDSEE